MSSLITQNSRFDDLFRNFFLQPSRLSEWQDLTIRTDIAEDERAYRLKADIPGVKKDDIEVKINGNQLYINAELKREKVQKKDEKVTHSERYYGQVSRSFMFDKEIDAAHAEAKYENGVLALTLPKLSVSPLKQLKVQ